MAHTLTFKVREKYDTRVSGVEIEVALSLSEANLTCRAKIDTSAQACLFQRELGDLLGLEIEDGHRREFDSIAGSLIAYGHSVTLHTLGLAFDSVVYFAANYGLRRNLLGREGWLSKVRLAIVDYDSEVFLSRYEE
jgi:hypothetical protein